jgi:SAM-dependent methyltransferase
MFERSVAYYDALYAFKNSPASAERLRATIARLHPGARTILDVACGTGFALAELQPFYEVEGVDLSAEMLAAARARCPTVRVHQADMAAFELNRVFDVVTCLFSSIAYVETVQRLRTAIASMARHLAPGGLLLVEPWFTPDTYWTDRLTANVVDEPDLKISWMYLSRLVGRLSVLDIHFQVGTPRGIEQFVERHQLGLFTHEEYLESFTAAGLRVMHEPDGVHGRGLYVGRT